MKIQTLSERDNLRIELTVNTLTLETHSVVSNDEKLQESIKRAIEHVSEAIIDFMSEVQERRRKDGRATAQNEMHGWQDS